MRVVVLDIQGFNIPEFIPKELTIYDGYRMAHFCFKPPKPFSELDEEIKKQVRYLEVNHHHLRYSNGDIDYASVFNIIRQHLFTERVDIIYVKGWVKEQFLQYTFNQFNDVTYYPRIINLETSNTIPKLPMQWPLCTNHILRNTPAVCSVNNVYFIYNWICKQLPE